MTGTRGVSGVVARTWATPPGVSTAGSLYAVATELRLAAARLLHEQGRWVHVDVMVADGRPAGGVAVEELAAVRAALPGARVEVHLISRDGRGAHLDAVVPQVLDAGPQRLVLPVHLCGSGPLLRRVRSSGAQPWAEVAPDTRLADVRAEQDAVDGALVMLIPPGTREDADLARLATVRLLAPHLPVGVDGGVGPDNTPACLSAGAVHLVSGRALLRPRGLTTTVLEGAR